jgi:hypothetical protein
LNEIISEPVAAGDDVLDLGKLLGRREALALVAGRCSAAEAAYLREIRETRKFRTLSPNWGQFCEERLHMSKANADRIIRIFEKFGPGYFALAGLTRISPEAYAQIADSVSADGVRWNGEVIALLPENSDRLSAAVKEMKQSAERPDAPNTRARIDAVEKRSGQVTAELSHLVTMKPGGQDLERIQSILDENIRELVRIQRRLPG